MTQTNGANAFRRFLSVFLAVALFLTMIPVWAWSAELDTGSGTESDPYLISTAKQLKTLSDDVKNGESYEGTYFKLTADIDLGGEGHSWTPIGVYDVYIETVVDEEQGHDLVQTDNSTPFAGVFDGNGHTICGLYIDSSNEDDRGLFGYVSGGTVKNLTVEGVVNGRSYVGGIVGRNNGTLENCRSNVEVSGSNYVGGIAGGALNDSSIENCINIGSVTAGGASGSVGGIAGLALSDVKNCYNTGDVTLTDGKDAGGIVGYNAGNTIENCYNTGSVTGMDNATGGIVGNNYGQVLSCYNVGKITGPDAGGISGLWNDGSSAKNCYYLADTASQGTASGSVSGMERISSADFGSLASKLGSEWADGLNGRPVLIAIAETTYAIDGEYLIYNVELFEEFRDYINGTNDFSSSNTGEGKIFTLTEDIDLSGICGEELGSWTPIGNISTPFKGTFNGGGHMVSGLYISEPDSNYQGLFGYADNAVIKNLKAAGNISGDRGVSYVGGIVGYLGSGTIENCGSSVTVVFGNKYDGYDREEESPEMPMMTENGSYFGGVAGYVGGGTVKNCNNSGAVSGNDVVGGVVGYMGSGTVNNCYNTGIVKGNGGVIGYNYADVSNCHNIGDVFGDWNVGGIAGVNYSSIENCYNNGDITGNGNYAGGIAGANRDGAEIKKCYNTGDISSEREAGGIVGYNYQSTTENCYNKGDIKTNIDRAGGIAGVNVGGTIENCYSIGEVVGGKTPFGEVVGDVESDSTENNCYYSDDGGKTFNSHDKSENGLTPAELAEKLGSEWITDPNGNPILASNTEYLSEGDGSQSDPYLISDADQLRMVSANSSLWDKCFLLNEDIDLGGKEKGSWKPIGNYDVKFSGTFDGDGHTISGLYIYAQGQTYQGLFGYVDGGSIKDLTVDGSVAGGNEVGGIVGNMPTGTISNCTYVGTVTSAPDEYDEPFAPKSHSNNFGGIVGYTQDGKVENCRNFGSISGGEAVGGIAGYIYNDAQVTKCYNAGNVSGYNNVGGVVGESCGTVKNCYNIAEVSVETNYIGGVAGFGRNGIIEYCYNIGTLHGGQYVGGVVGGLETFGSIGKAANNCFLFTTADHGIGETESDDGAVCMTEFEFKYGKAAFVLQKGQGEQVWYQDLTNDLKDAYPVLTGDDSTKVIEFTFVDPTAYANPNGTATVPDGSVITPPGSDAKLTAGDNGDKTTVDVNGNVTVPEGGSVRIGDTTVTFPEGGTITPNSNGSFDVPDGSEVKVGDTDVTLHDGGTVKKNGSVSIPEGGSIELNGTDITLPNGGTIDTDGNVSVPEEGSFEIGGTAVTLPKGGNIEFDDDGNAVIPDDADVRFGDTDITLPNGSTVNKDGSVNVPKGGSVEIGDTTVTLPNGGKITPNSDGTVSIPGGSVVERDGETTVIPKDGATLDPKTGKITYSTYYTVTFDSNGGSRVTSARILHGEQLNRPKDPTKKGYTFEGWFTDAGCKKAYDFSTPVTGNITLYAKWAEAAKDPGNDKPNDPNVPDDPNKPNDPNEPNVPDDPNKPVEPPGSVINPSPDNTDKPSDGSGSVSVVIGGDKDIVSIDINSANKLIASVTASLTDKEKEAIANGADLEIILTVDISDGAVPDEDIQAVEKFIANTNYKVGQYLNISVFKKINGKEVRVLTELDAPIALTIKLPEALRSSNRSFASVRVHEGVAALLEDKDNASDTLTIATDKFSTYAVVYKDNDFSIGIENPNTGEERTGGITFVVLAGAINFAALTIKKKK